MRGGHQVPGGGAAVAPPLSEPDTVDPLTPGEEARTLVAGTSDAMLSTIATDPAGFPFGSVAPFALTDDGDALLCLSQLAEHTQNLRADPRASLLVVERPDGSDQVAAGRVTLVGEARAIDDDESAAAQARWLEANPGGGYAYFGDFRMWRLAVTAVRWIGGFGRMDWCTLDDWRSARPDPVRPYADGAVEHLNHDHADAVLDWVRAFAGHPDAESAQIARLDHRGVDVRLRGPRGVAEARIGYDAPVTTPDELRKACVRLTRRARQHHFELRG